MGRPSGLQGERLRAMQEMWAAHGVWGSREDRALGVRWLWCGDWQAPGLGPAPTHGRCESRTGRWEALGPCTGNRPVPPVSCAATLGRATESSSIGWAWPSGALQGMGLVGAEGGDASRPGALQ